mgnify:CR=1 FL=1
MIWAWIGAAAVGLSLGLLGSGGAILTVPILVCIVGHDEKVAIAESLAIVGAIAVAGVVRAAPQGRVDFRSAALLAFPGIAGAYLGATAARFIPGALQLLLLAVLMSVAATLMFRNGMPTADAIVPSGTGLRSSARALFLVAVQGIGLGLATGLVGVGGGFLIVPVLVLLRRLPMASAVGTSLAIIAVNSAAGFWKYHDVLREHVGADGHLLRVDWMIIAVFSAVGVAGSLVGNLLAGRIRQDVLKRVFAAFLVIMAAYMIIRQAPRVFPAIFGGPSPIAQPAGSNRGPDWEPSPRAKSLIGGDEPVGNRPGQTGPGGSGASHDSDHE